MHCWHSQRRMWGSIDKPLLLWIKAHSLRTYLAIYDGTTPAIQYESRPVLLLIYIYTYVCVCVLLFPTVWATVEQHVLSKCRSVTFSIKLFWPKSDSMLLPFHASNAGFTNGAISESSSNFPSPMSWKMPAVVKGFVTEPDGKSDSKQGKIKNKKSLLHYFFSTEPSVEKSVVPHNCQCFSSSSSFLDVENQTWETVVNVVDNRNEW